MGNENDWFEATGQSRAQWVERMQGRGGRRKEEGGSRLVREGEAFVGIFSKSAVQRLTSPRARAVIHRKESTRVDGTWK